MSPPFSDIADAQGLSVDPRPEGTGEANALRVRTGELLGTVT